MSIGSDCSGERVPVSCFGERSLSVIGVNYDFSYNFLNATG